MNDTGLGISLNLTMNDLTVRRGVNKMEQVTEENIVPIQAVQSVNDVQNVFSTELLSDESFAAIVGAIYPKDESWRAIGKNVFIAGLEAKEQAYELKKRFSDVGHSQDALTGVFQTKDADKQIKTELAKAKTMQDSIFGEIIRKDNRTQNEIDYAFSTYTQSSDTQSSDNTYSSNEKNDIFQVT